MLHIFCKTTLKNFPPGLNVSQSQVISLISIQNDYETEINAIEACN